MRASPASLLPARRCGGRRAAGACSAHDNSVRPISTWLAPRHVRTLRSPSALCCSYFELRLCALRLVCGPSQWWCVRREQEPFSTQGLVGDVCDGIPVRMTLPSSPPPRCHWCPCTSRAYRVNSRPARPQTRVAMGIAVGTAAVANAAGPPQQVLQLRAASTSSRRDQAPASPMSTASPMTGVRPALAAATSHASLFFC